MNFDLIRKHISPTSILDIGANVGGFYHEAKQHWPDAYFLLIEGNPACAEMLAATGASHRIALLSDSEKEVTFHTRKGAPTCTGASYLREQTEFYNDENLITETLSTQRLDDLLDGQPFQLIKIDTQGSELDIFRGGENTLAAAKAVIMEVSHVEYNAGAPMAPDVFRFMEERGFRFGEKLGDIVHPTTRAHIQSDILFLRL